MPVTRTDRDAQTDNGTGHNMCHHLRKGVSQKEETGKACQSSRSRACTAVGFGAYPLRYACSHHRNRMPKSR